jgi:hypothetical protein
VQRLWLTPLFRALLRVGLPAFVVIAALLWYATDEQKVQALMDQVAEIRREIEDRPEFRINVLSIEGASPTVTEEVRGTLALTCRSPLSISTSMTSRPGWRRCRRWPPPRSATRAAGRCLSR